MDKILVETSARHVHVTREALDYLFGPDYQLTAKKMLSQPGQYASTTKLEIIGPKGSMMASILGPERKVNQVEISATEARTLGIKAPVRESGDVKGSAPITIKNPENGKEIQLTEGCIIAKRHIHMTPEDAANFKVNNGDIVWVKVMTMIEALFLEIPLSEFHQNINLLCTLTPMNVTLETVLAKYTEKSLNFNA